VAVDARVILAYLQKIQFSKNKSDVVAKEDGSFVKREKRKIEQPAPPQPAAPQQPGQPIAVAQPPPPKRQAQPRAQQNQPHNILFCQGLPDNCTDQMLVVLFTQYTGYKEVRLIAAKNVAFVEFEDSIQAGIALQQLNGFKLTPEQPMSVSYARK
jgi:U2 small nuclear ribonucleoprotein B''